MKESRYTVKMSVAAALRFRVMFHFFRFLQIVIAPVLLYVMLFYKNTREIHKFDLPSNCLFTAIDQTPWWNIPPYGLILVGFLLYGVIVWIFHDRNNESGIVNLVNKNINSDELVEVKI
ncbi:MAG: hypothetical protein F4X56_07360 [Gammaproteobacteria bacterium]|nr:hypothetical protein [Gammaproteobacteria bacterium]MYC25718.1 hypothetical protein [Gammaproteobacteria bacterium]